MILDDGYLFTNIDYQVFFFIFIHEHTNESFDLPENYFLCFASFPFVQFFYNESIIFTLLLQCILCFLTKISLFLFIFVRIPSIIIHVKHNSNLITCEWQECYFLNVNIKTASIVTKKGQSIFESNKIFQLIRFSKITSFL